MLQHLNLKQKPFHRQDAKFAKNGGENLKIAKTLFRFVFLGELGGEIVSLFCFPGKISAVFNNLR
jgi:hypothetical protein